MSSILFPYYQYIGELYICFYYIFLEISSESMATKEAAEINEEAVAPKAPIKEEDAAKALEKEEMWNPFTSARLQFFPLIFLFERLGGMVFFEGAWVATASSLISLASLVAMLSLLISKKNIAKNIDIIPLYIGNMETK